MEMELEMEVQLVVQYGLQEGTHGRKMCMGSRFYDQGGWGVGFVHTAGLDLFLLWRRCWECAYLCVCRVGEGDVEVGRLYVMFIGCSWVVSDPVRFGRLSQFIKLRLRAWAPYHGRQRGSGVEGVGWLTRGQ